MKLPIKTRQDLVAWIQNASPTAALEVGPFDCPVLRGDNVAYFDVLDREGLERRAIEIGRTENLKNIPHIDHVSRSGDLRSVPATFDVVLSSHAIEHQIDLVDHLLQVESILRPFGMYVVICPDKRYCFDHFIPESSIAEVLEAHNSNRTNHTLGSVIEHRALTCHNDPMRHWKGDHGQYSVREEKIRSAIAEHRASTSAGEYLDVHAWQFTPESFEEIITLLYNLDYISLRSHSIIPTQRNTHEFFAVLTKE